MLLLLGFSTERSDQRSNKKKFRRIFKGCSTKCEQEKKLDGFRTGCHANCSRLKDAGYDLVFCHPKVFLSCKEGMSLFQSPTYQHAVKAIVVDEAHCILEW